MGVWLILLGIIGISALYYGWYQAVKKPEDWPERIPVAGGASIYLSGMTALASYYLLKFSIQKASIMAVAVAILGLLFCIPSLYEMYRDICWAISEKDIFSAAFFLLGTAIIFLGLVSTVVIWFQLPWIVSLAAANL